jgi:hypothetical protein
VIFAVAFGFLWLAVGYLAILGLIALIRPVAAQRFLGGFAQTRSANLVEALCRLAIGVAFIVAAPQLPGPWSMRIVGGFLALTALLMLLLPSQHLTLASRSVARVTPYLRLIGVASLGLAAALVAVLAGWLE